MGVLLVCFVYWLIVFGHCKGQAKGYERLMEERTRLRHQWIADNILQWEAEVRRWLGRYTRTMSAHDIDDLIQEAYARLWSADFAQIRDGRTFLYSVVRNVLRDQLRRARVVPMEFVAEMDALYIDEAPGPERWASAHQQYERLLCVLENLTPQRRKVYQLRKFEGLSVREIAQKLGIAEKTAENLLGLAHAQVIKALFAQGIVPASQTSERDYERGSKTDRFK
jgi:RNA polymerase sigma factor (sigma-70 family)